MHRPLLVLAMCTTANTALAWEGTDAGGAYGYATSGSGDPDAPIHSFTSLASLLADASYTRTTLALRDDDNRTVSLGGAYRWYGVSYTRVEVSSNGHVGFGALSVGADLSPDAACRRRVCSPSREAKLPPGGVKVEAARPFRQRGQGTRR